MSGRADPAMQRSALSLVPATPVTRPMPAQSGSATGFASAIYEGSVRHRRHAPKPHAFRYKVAMLYVDLGELARLFDRRWLWSVERRNVVAFRRSDFLGDAARPLDECVRELVANTTGRYPDGPIRLLTHLRMFGHSFNPVSFYYCYESDGSTLQAIVAEVTNTPWKQRHAYVLPVASADLRGTALSWEFDKQFHVSPFMAMQHDYVWRFTPPGETLRVHMDVLRRGIPAACEFDATLVLERREIGAGSLARVLWRYPLMTTRIVFAIHWQAVRLWLRGNPIHTHPDNKASP